MESLDSISSYPSVVSMAQPQRKEASAVEDNLVSMNSDAIFAFLDDQADAADAAGESCSEQAEKIKQLAAEIKERMIELEEITKEIAGGDMNLKEITDEKNQMEQIVDDAIGKSKAEELLGGGHIVGLTDAAGAVNDKVSITTIYEEKFSADAGEHARGNA